MDTALKAVGTHFTFALVEEGTRLPALQRPGWRRETAIALALSEHLGAESACHFDTRTGDYVLNAFLPSGVRVYTARDLHVLASCSRPAPAR